MTNSTRRTFLKNAAVASLGSLVEIKAALAQIAPGQSNPPGSSPTARSQASRLARSKRDLMLEVLDMSTTPRYVPAGFFMHFGVRGDAAVKAHLDYFHSTGMDSVKIQFDEQTLKLPANVQIKSPRDWAKIPILPEKK